MVESGVALSSVENPPPRRPVSVWLLGANHASRPGRRRREVLRGHHGLD